MSGFTIGGKLDGDCGCCFDCSKTNEGGGKAEACDNKSPRSVVSCLGKTKKDEE